jgi:hypothetical protein
MYKKFVVETMVLDIGPQRYKLGGATLNAAFKSFADPGTG